MTHDIAVIGAGVFGCWTAHALTRAGLKVLLIDAYGPANARASSGGESRLIRMGYGTDEIYTRMSKRSLGLWKDLFARTGRPLFHETGILWLARSEDPHLDATLDVLSRNRIAHEKLSQSELRPRYPHMNFDEVAWGIFEPRSGAILARRAVQAVVDDAIAHGLEYRTETYTPHIRAGQRIFACGPWLPKLFPDLLGSRIFPTRQEVFFFGTPPGDCRYTTPHTPGWLHAGELYGFPDIEGRGFKVACDRHGPPADPDNMERLVSPESVAGIRARMSAIFPGLSNAPLLETRVCQYENTSNGDFLIDRHPEQDKVWIVGGGSGHGFKHGPAVGEYVANLIAGAASVEPRFSLATKAAVQRRSVY